ncbi:hypothetical protein RJ640_024409 [Escallonia rubra]|uniref:NADP-dependent oxidoreductase domain-containing protein n=1 Tax=Escallonia rubra TaxID=112253 RepID=A0AA88UB35_9ASTE|nr:hypothetical protein RJ640_024409 [Escallonia rubra]
MATTIPEVPISSSAGAAVTMPVIAMGTAGQLPVGAENIKSAILEAIKAGYRHFDTAAVYRTEQPLGQAIQEAVRLGLIESRAEVFITTKLWCNRAERDLVVPAIKESLKNLGMEYVDLYLIHWPLRLTQEEFKVPIPKECVLAIDIKSVWERMEECQKLGLTRAIGVSNFSSKRLDEILSFATIPPAVNQVEMNPLWQQKDLREFCKAKGIHLSAYSPLGAAGTAWGDKRIVESNVLVDIARAKGKTTAQVSLRWLYEQGVSIIAKSFNKDRMKENLQIFCWSLTEEEMKQISQLPQRKGVLFSQAVEINDLVQEIDSEI